MVALAPDARVEALDQLRGDDVDLRSELEALLLADDRAGEVLIGLDRQLPWHLPAAGNEQHDPLVGHQVAHYRILERLGGGGMGVVYKARDLKLERAVALKFLPPHLSLEPHGKRRLIREAKAASALDHPNLCTIHEIGETDEGQLFLALAYYLGETLEKKIERGPLPLSDALAYAAQIADGLQRAHEAGIVHRDIKPANVLITERSQVKLVDFGIAKVQGEELTRTGGALGTAAYMSPEQTRGDAVDHRTDLWSLGVVLYEMLTGMRPFRGEHEQAVIYAIRNDAAEPVDRLSPESPAGLELVVARCLEKDPEARYQRAEELLRDLRAAQEGRSIHQQARGRSRPGNWAVVFGGAGLLVVSAVVAVGLLTGIGDRDALDSVAVLPLANFTGDPDQEYLANGMTDELISTLAQIQALRVISRTSVMRYKETSTSLSEIARELRVEAVVEGSVRLAGERVEISVRLLDAATERQLWEERFERERHDLASMQHDMARVIAQVLGVSLTGPESERLIAAPEVDPIAFDLYLKGTQARYTQTRDAYLEAKEYFAQAIARDSGYAPAYAGLASVHLFSDDPAEARRLADKAIELDPSLAEPHVVLGLVRQGYDWDWGGAEEAFRHAIRLDPGNAEAHHELSMHLMRLKRFDEALREAQLALRVAPMSARFQHGLGEVHYHSGRYDEAVAAADRALALGGYDLHAHAIRGGAYAQQGRFREAVEALQKSIPVFDNWGRGWVGYVYAISGDRKAALELLEEIDTASGEGREYGVAMIHAGLGERDQALDWLERAPRHALAYLAIDPCFSSLHAEPRFQALLERVGLAE